MIRNLRVSVVFPCRNEEKSIAGLIQSMPPGVDEVIVADNCSTDHTADAARAAGAIVVDEPRTVDGIGYGYALRSGFAAATGDVLVSMDADGTYPVGSIDAIVNALVDGNLDFISCSRMPRAKGETLWVRVLGVRILNIVARVLFGYRLRDSLTGMWVFKRKSFPPEWLVEGGWDLSLEIKLRAITAPSVQFAEYHIPYKDRTMDQSKQQIFHTGYGHLKYLLRFRREHPNLRAVHTHPFIFTE